MKNLIGMLLLALAALTPAPSARAEEARTGQLTVTPLVGWHQFDGNQYLESRPSGGVALGYAFTGGWSLEAAGSYVDTYHNWRGRGGSVDVYTLHLDLLKDLLPKQRLTPYLVAGLGALLTEEEKRNGGHKDEDLLFNYGVGLKYTLPEGVALRLDLRHLLDSTENDQWESDDLYHNATVTFGIVVPIGRKTAAAKPVAEVAAAPAAQAAEVAPLAQVSPVLADSDGDGVEDRLDRCEVTPAGTPVDQFGCPRSVWRDSDGDSVGDEVDRCPDTPAGVPVDPYGCVRDSDGDGIADASDRCPNTPATVPVNGNGCPRDSDGDQVFDIDDRCPETPAGTAVDANGCPVPQAPANALAAAIEAEKRGLRLNILFAAGKAEIAPRYRAELAAAADYLMSHPQGRYVVEGHTDSVGGAGANRTLSEKRAQSVRNYLIKNFGIDPGRLEARGIGEGRPIGDNATAEGRSLNRRVVLVPKTP